MSYRCPCKRGSGRFDNRGEGGMKSEAEHGRRKLLAKECQCGPWSAEARHVCSPRAFRGIVFLSKPEFGPTETDFIFLTSGI